MPSKRGKQRPVLLLYLRIRVYIDRIDLLTCDVSLQHYYLQLKENFLEHWNTNSIASEERCWQMAFLALQADKIVLDDTLFKVEKYFPLWIVNLRGIDYIKKNINQLITEHKKYNSKDAMIAFCQESSRSPFALNCHLYGIRRHKADVLDNTLIGILDKGIELWDVKENSERIPLKVLNWNKMTKLSFDKKKVKISVSDGYDVEVFAQNDTKARYLLTFYIAKTNPFFNGEICPSTSRASSSITQRSSMAESSQSTSGVVSDNHEGSPDVSQKIHYTKTNSNNGSMESMNSSLSENYRDNNCYGEREACNNLTTIKDSGSLEATPNSSGDLSALKQIKVSLKSAEVEELSDKLRHTSVGENNDYLLRNKCKSNDSGTPISRRLKKNDLQQFGNPSNMNTNIQQQCDNMPSNLSVPPEYNNRLNYNKPKSIIKTCTEAPIIAEMGIKPTQLKEYPMMRALLQENYELPISSNGSSPSATLTSFSSSSQDNSGNGYSSSKQGTISNNRIKILPTLATQKSEYHSENTDLVCNHCHQPSPNTPHKHNSFQHNQSLLQPSMKNETEVFRYFNPSDFGINDPACEIPTSSANQYNFNRQSNAQSGIAYREPNINQQMPVQSYLPNNVKLNTNKFSHHHLFANHSDDYVLDLGPPPPYPTVNAAH
uniref:FERM domain-containing protein n=1 Tax=Rhabditophanes sp. KR3021 TaxID=114890 RepID=A0AC35UHM3_9BILA